jgi:hypothetical protein
VISSGADLVGLPLLTEGMGITAKAMCHFCQFLGVHIHGLNGVYHVNSFRELPVTDPLRLAIHNTQLPESKTSIDIVPSLLKTEQFVLHAAAQSEASAIEIGKSGHPSKLNGQKRKPPLSEFYPVPSALSHCIGHQLKNMLKFLIYYSQNIKEGKYLKKHSDVEALRGRWTTYGEGDRLPFQLTDTEIDWIHLALSLFVTPASIGSSVQHVFRTSGAGYLKMHECKLFCSELGAYAMRHAWRSHPEYMTLWCDFCVWWHRVLVWNVKESSLESLEAEMFRWISTFEWLYPTNGMRPVVHYLGHTIHVIRLK